MTTLSELMEIIANGENSGVEFKRDDLRPQDLAKELVAFSNLEGGMVLLGVEDNGTVSGLSRNNPEEWVMSVCRDKIRPEINPRFEVVQGFQNNKSVAIVQVGRGLSVHSLWHNNIHRYLMRVGTQSREASQPELARLFQQRRAIQAELQPILGSTLEHLDMRRVRNYFDGIRPRVRITDSEEDELPSLLLNNDIMTDGNVTLGGMVLFGETPGRWLRYAKIEAIALAGTEQDYDAEERITLNGPITPLLAANRNIVENGLVEQALDFVHRNTRRTTELVGGRRVERPTYPTEAVREAVVNALVHRDYLFTGTDIILAIYGDRLEIVSPGRLPNGMTPAKMLAGRRSTRNQLLREIMRDYGYMENMGMGVRLKLVKGMWEHNRTEPELIAEDDLFTVRLIA